MFRPRILLADDYAAMHSALARLLAPMCDVVGYSTSGDGMLEDARRLQPDAVVLDINMPGLDGLEACRRLKATTPETRIIVFTAAADAATRERALEVGASAFVLKSRAGDDLLPAILKALEGEAPFDA